MEKAAIHRTVDSGANTIGPNQIGDKFGDLTSVIRKTCNASTANCGMSLVALLGASSNSSGGGSGSLFGMLGMGAGGAAAVATGGSAHQPGTSGRMGGGGDDAAGEADELVSLTSFGVPGFAAPSTAPKVSPGKLAPNTLAEVIGDPGVLGERDCSAGAALPNKRAQRGAGRSGGAIVTAKAKAKASTGKRGRPAKDPSVQARIEIDSFEQVTLDKGSPNYRAFFADEWRTKERGLKYLLSNLTAHIDTTEDIEVFDLLGLDKKRLEAIITICAAFSKMDRDGCKGLSNAVDEARLCPSSPLCPP